MAATQLIIRALYSLRDMVTPALAEGINLLLYIPVSIGLAHLLGAPGLAAALTERLAPAQDGCPITACVVERAEVTSSNGG